MLPLAGPGNWNQSVPSVTGSPDFQARISKHGSAAMNLHELAGDSLEVDCAAHDHVARQFGLQQF